MTYWLPSHEEDSLVTATCNADVSILSLANAVHDAAHESHRHRFHDLIQARFELSHK